MVGNDISLYLPIMAKPRRPRDMNELAKLVGGTATGQHAADAPPSAAGETGLKRRQRPRKEALSP